MTRFKLPATAGGLAALVVMVTGAAPLSLDRLISHRLLATS